MRRPDVRAARTVQAIEALRERVALDDLGRATEAQQAADENESAARDAADAAATAWTASLSGVSFDPVLTGSFASQLLGREASHGDASDRRRAARDQRLDAEQHCQARGASLKAAEHALVVARRRAARQRDQQQDATTADLVSFSWMRR